MLLDVEEVLADKNLLDFAELPDRRSGERQARDAGVGQDFGHREAVIHSGLSFGLAHRDVDVEQVDISNANGLDSVTERFESRKRRRAANQVSAGGFRHGRGTP